MLSHESLQTELDSTQSYHHSPSKPRSRLFRKDCEKMGNIWQTFWKQNRFRGIFMNWNFTCFSHVLQYWDLWYRWRNLILHLIVLLEVEHADTNSATSWTAKMLAVIVFCTLDYKSNFMLLISLKCLKCLKVFVVGTDPLISILFSWIHWLSSPDFTSDMCS